VNKISIWASVQVSNVEHARHGAAGIVFGHHPKHPDEVAVRFDEDSAIFIVPVADLSILG
jgi:hypothetical protein